MEPIPRAKIKHRLLKPFIRKYAEKAAFFEYPAEERVIFPHVTLTKDGRYAFIKNSKAGCTTVANLLWLRDNGEEYDGNIHHAPSGRLSSHADLVKIRTAMESAFLFSVVRNPARRAVSGFFNFFIERTNNQAHLHWEPIVGYGFLHKDDLSYKFDIFLDYIEASMAIARIDMDRHFRPQHINIGADVFALDYIARLERLQEDLNRIGELAEAPLPGLSSLSRSRRNKSGASEFTPSAMQTRRLEKLYERDYQLYGY